MSAPPSVLEVRDLRIVRGRRDVLNVPGLHVDPGETVAVLGPNGAGKSTLLLASALLLPVAGGSVRLFGQHAARGGDAVRLRRGTATVFQDPGLLDMSALRNVETALRLHGVPRDEREPRARAWLERLGVGALADARPHTLSGGEAQRVSLARAFAVEPRLIFLDEPFSALDPASRARLVGDLRALLATEGIAALLATHDLSEAHLLADRVIVLLEGRAAQIGAVGDVFSRPANAEVAAFLGYSVVDSALLRGLLPGPADRHDGDRGAVAFVPPSGVHLADGPGSDVASGPVVAVLGALGEGRIVVDVGAPLTVEVPITRIRDEHIAAGSVVSVRIDLEQVIWT